jgi:peptidoglycan/xylan/chitin deacetylase (PgdA/CDA1 family)
VANALNRSARLGGRGGAATLLLLASVARAAAPTAVVPPEPVPGVIVRLPTEERVVALSFDACQAVERMQLDRGITDFLVARQIPFTIFAGGRFARDNAADLRELARYPFVEIENHSWSHRTDMRLLDDDKVKSEVLRAQAMIESVSGRKPRLFRFPGGNADERTVGIVRALGFEVVHWRWAEGDPDPAASADRLVAQTLKRTRPGEILIFHVNGRGWHTAEALPRLVAGLKQQGYRFVPLSESLGTPQPGSSRQ